MAFSRTLAVSGSSLAWLTLSRLSTKTRHDEENGKSVRSVEVEGEDGFAEVEEVVLGFAEVEDDGAPGVLGVARGVGRKGVQHVRVF